LLRHRLARHWVLSPEEVAQAIVRVVERGGAEIMRPRSLRIAGVAQSLAPATIARIMARWGRSA
jgi:short-subunit dehydrogenase